MKRLCCFVLALLLVLSSVQLCLSDALWDDEEEVDLDFGIVTDTASGGEAEQTEPEETPIQDPSQPVYENDGSILLTMTFSGDFTIGNNVQSSSTSIFEKELKKQSKNQSFMFRNIKDVLLEDDLTVINFEGTLTTSGRNPEKKNNDFLFRAAPEYAQIIRLNGVDAVSLENNHIMDMGKQGFEDTKQNLTEAGIYHASEDDPAVFWVKGVKIGMLAYQTFGNRHDEIAEKLPDQILALRNEGCQFVVVNYHWGAEKDYTPNNKQVKLGRATIDAGADLVIGHHSHRINPIEYYNDHYICYSLGNFIFAGNNKPSDMYSYLFQIRLRFKDGDVHNEAIRIVPGRISSRSDYNDFAFTPVTKTETLQSIMNLLKSYSKNLEYALETYPTKWPDE